MKFSCKVISLLTAIGIIAGCSQPKGGGEPRKSRTSAASLENNKKDSSNSDALNPGAVVSDDILSLISYDPQPFDKVFPDVKDRFIIDSFNNVYFDFQRADGSWDIENKYKATESPEDFYNVEARTSKLPNLLFSVDLGLSQFQPARLASGAVIVFFIDREKNLKAIKQISPQSDQWQNIASATPIDSNIEMVYVFENSENKVEVVYIKKIGADPVMIKRTLTDENEIALSVPEINDAYTGLTDISTLLSAMKDSSKKQGLILLSIKEIDKELSKAIIAGNAETKSAAVGSGANLVNADTEVGAGYSDNGFEKSWTGKDSFGGSVTSKKGWDSPTDICSNIATVVVGVPLLLYLTPLSYTAVGIYVAIGSLAEYSKEDSTAKSAGEAGANILVESPILAAEAVNGTHSTAGAFCRGDAVQILKGLSSSLAAGGHLLVDGTDGLFKLICDGMEALDKDEFEGYGKKGKDATVHGARDGLCETAAGVHFASNCIRNVIDISDGYFQGDGAKEVVDETSKAGKKTGKGIKNVFGLVASSKGEGDENAKSFLPALKLSDDEEDDCSSNCYEDNGSVMIEAGKNTSHALSKFCKEK